VLDQKAINKRTLIDTFRRFLYFTSNTLQQSRAVLNLCMHPLLHHEEHLEERSIPALEYPAARLGEMLYACANACGRHATTLDLCPALSDSFLLLINVRLLILELD
jgi:hypothetical protein